MNIATGTRFGIQILLGAALTAPLPAGGQPGSPRIDFHSDLKEADKRLLSSPDGERTVVVNGSGVARLIDAMTGKPAGPELKHTTGFEVLCWAFSPDGKLVVTGAGRRVSDKKPMEQRAPEVN